MLSLDDLLALPHARLHQRAAERFTGLAYDSRLAQPGELFLALTTPHGDGHRYLEDALAAGCAGLLCRHAPQLNRPASVVLVPDVLDAVQTLAARRLRALQPAVLAVTGSVGKTSLTHALATLLDGALPTFRSPRSFNSLLGLPVALAQLQPQHRAAVLEFGIDRRGEMARLAALFPPTIALVTNIGAAHLDLFENLDAIADEKGLLVEALPAQGCAILNADDPRTLALRRRSPAPIMTFGLEADADLRASELRFDRDGTRFVLDHGGRRWPLRVALLGRPGVATVLAALAGALAFGMPLEAALARLDMLRPLAGRLQPLAGRNGVQLLDDSYSASPPSLAAALETLTALPGGRRVAVLGDMQGLGTQAVALHRAAGAAAASLDRLVTLGDMAAEIAAGAKEAGLASERISVTHTLGDALAAVQQGLEPGDLVLVKGDRPARLERALAALLAPGLDPAQLLVRQEPAWQMLRVAEPGRPTWLEIDLDAIAGNTRLLRAAAGPGVELMAVLKGDAYGHGALRVARTVLANGATQLAVATLGEAQVLRAGGVRAPILVLGYTPPWQAHEALALEVACTVFDLDCARALAAAATALGRQAQVHLKIDTGMARLGVMPDDALPMLDALLKLPQLDVVGIFTHLACADEADLAFSYEQLRRFEAVLAAIRAAGLPLPPVHAANSAALLRLPQSHYAMARPGIALYGLAPGPATPLPPGFRPALSWKTRIARVAELPAGTPVGYGGSYVTPAPQRIATIPVGYADGFRRMPHWREVLVGGQRAPVVGRVCMDYAMIAVDAAAQVGDDVVLLGRQGSATISADEVAGWLGTNSYEVVAAIMPRVPRVAG